jgi:hypothetical protein
MLELKIKMRNKSSSSMNRSFAYLYFGGERSPLDTFFEHLAANVE